MSEYDQIVGHQVNSSGNCVISGCPCRGWSAQEGAGLVAKEEPVMTLTTTTYSCPQCGEGFPSKADMQSHLFSLPIGHQKQPTARGGGDLVTTARDFVIHLGEARKTALCKAITHTADLFKSQKIINQLADEVIVQRNAVDNVIQQQMNRHQSLVAERERLRKLLKAAVNAMRSYQYGNSSPDLADEIQQAVNAALSDQNGMREG